MEAGLRVMCVDDERIARSAMVEMLRARGAYVEAESDPIRALERLRKEPFDVLVTDLAMPEVDGIELVARVRDLPNPPGCVLVTALSGSKLDLSGLPHGTVAGVLNKPFGEVDLWEVVDQAARARRAGGEQQAESVLELLVLEDDPDAAEHVRALLTRGGLDYELHLCARLDEALERVATRNFGMALVDLNLPDARGLDAVRRIRTVSPETPLVVLSEEGERWGEAAIELGAQEVLQKATATPEALVAAVQRALKRRRAERRAADLAFRDSLTGLFNARYFMRRLSEAVALSAREGKASAVLLIDLDGFKDINDNFGHAAGDAALKEVARRLRDALRDYDTVARMGGDEFVVLVQGLEDRSILAGLAQRLVELISQPMRIGRHRVTLGASVGVAIAPECGLEPGTLLRVADRAMYAAKATGSGIVRFALGPITESVVPEALSMPPPMAAPKLWLYAQADDRDPAYCCHRVELSVRDDPQRTTADVLRSYARAESDAALLIAALRRALCEIPGNDALSITVPVELFDTRLLDELLKTPFIEAAARITFELHAPSLLSSHGSLRVMLEAVRDAGYRIAMRDFGGAAMRPDTLASLPLDTLRLDSRVVIRAEGGGVAERLLQALVLFGRSLGFQVMVDELRSERHVAVARAADCDRVLRRQYVRELSWD